MKKYVIKLFLSSIRLFLSPYFFFLSSTLLFFYLPHFFFYLPYFFFHFSYFFFFIFHTSFFYLPYFFFLSSILLFFYFPYFRRYFVETFGFSTLIFFSTTSCSSSKNYPNLMSSWLLIIFWINLSVTSEGFTNRFLKCFFHFCIYLFGWQFFCFAFEVLFLPFTLFTVCHTNHDCLSSTKFLILLIFSQMYCSCSFLYVLVLTGLS